MIRKNYTKFVNLPTESERQEIFKVHLQRLRPSRLRDFDLAKLASAAMNFSGAEIEQVIVDAMHLAFAAGRDFTTDDILNAIDLTVPLAAIAKRCCEAQIAFDQIEGLKRWAARAGARTASIDTQLNEELRQYSVQRGIKPLEVD